MCGRFTFAPEPSALLTVFPELVPPQGLPARYNVAPSNRVLTVTASTGRPAYEMLSWGLVPSWASDRRIASSLINARSESVGEKPAFRAAFRARRCLMLADGFYEWRVDGRRKRPYWFHLASGGVFAFAGLWECWKGEPEPLRTCALLTTEANATVAPVHHRMPVILDASRHAAWLDPDTSLESLMAMLVPLPGDQLVGHEVSSLVSSPRNDSPACIAPVDPDGGVQVETLSLF
ncbi:MAG: SOS response-associated peptidase [Proteobacteria bacterium]|nr:SOS response-associated peptidase [Pseudomonadota bacterium]